MKKDKKGATTMVISKDLWQYIHDNQTCGESKEQTLRRLLKLPELKK